VVNLFYSLPRKKPQKQENIMYINSKIAIADWKSWIILYTAFLNTALAEAHNYLNCIPASSIYIWEAHPSLLSLHFYGWHSLCMCSACFRFFSMVGRVGVGHVSLLEDLCIFLEIEKHMIYCDPFS
jgi:hypothetical protein